MEHPLLDQLWQIGSRITKSKKRTFMGAFDPIGLLLHRPLKHGGYQSTPLRTHCFGRTGGDGTHFSLLKIEERPFRDSPVVMTVPCALDGLEDNFVVGENLHEFLRLGFYRGYFNLEQLAYKPDDCIRYYSEPDPSAPNPQMDFLLKTLIKHFDLTPWSDIRSRLAELRRDYWSLLRLPTKEEVMRLRSK